MTETHSQSTAQPRPRLPVPIETERLLLRAPRPDDAPTVNEAVRESFAELQPWMAWAAEVPEISETQAHLKRASALFEQGEDFQLLAFLKDSDRFVIAMGLHRIDWSVPRFEIGYWCRTSCTGRGLVCEAVRALTAAAFDTLGARRVEIRMSTANQRSRRVAERAGFELEGVLRNFERHPDGSIRDTCIYAQVR